MPAPRKIHKKVQIIREHFLRYIPYINNVISLCEAGVGTDKTLAYLVACVLWQMNRPDRLKPPIVISTSSVALQDTIINDYPSQCIRSFS